MQTVEDEMPELPGQEAFLDVLTNMVGMIILLVVVMGLRASRAPVVPESAPEQSAAAVPELPETELESARRQARDAEIAVKELVHSALLVNREAQQRDVHRQFLVNHVAAFQQELDERRALLGEEEKREFDLRRKLVAAQSDLDDAMQEQVGLMSQPDEVQVIENRPTPIARRATGKRLFLQLRHGHVAVLPLDTYEELLVDEFKQNMWRLRHEKRVSLNVDAGDGFRIRYYMERRKATFRVGRTSEMDQYGEVASLVRFEIVPPDWTVGHPVEDAVRPGSELSNHLKRFPPDDGIIVVWVFPDSLAALHKLKRHLDQAGYSIAESPVAAEWIGISLDGSGHKLFAQ